MLSAWSLSFQVGLLITGLGLARVAETSGIPSALWLAAGALVLASLLYLLIDRRRVRHEPDELSSFSAQRTAEMIDGD
jgi:hypothetical protein